MNAWAKDFLGLVRTYYYGNFMCGKN